jgi:hypothetical protein
VSRSAFEAWAPAGATWSPWAKPAPFVGTALSTADQQSHDLPPAYELAASADTMVVVDLPGATCVQVALVLARNGYCPVPLINTTSGAREYVRMAAVLTALRLGAAELAARPPSSQGPPLFFLDARRLRGTQPEPGVYDNRWIALPQDFPSARLLLSRGVRSCVVLGDSADVADDLAHVLCRFQEAGIRLFSLLPGSGRKPQPLKLSPPRWYKKAYYRFLVTLGLRRNDAGGFGGVIAESSNAGYG